jgi:uncharacterized protein with HEPN domain
MRNVLAHKYFGMDLEEVWKTAAARIARQAIRDLELIANVSEPDEMRIRFESLPY